MSSSNATDIFKYTVILIVNTVYVNMTNKNVHKTLQPPIHKRIKSGTFLMHNFFMGCVGNRGEIFSKQVIQIQSNNILFCKKLVRTKHRR